VTKCERGVIAIEVFNLMQILMVFQNTLCIFFSFIRHDINFEMCDELPHNHTCTTFMKKLLKS
jgi:hypothetical protein